MVFFLRKQHERFFRRAGNVVIGISMEDIAVDIVRYGRNILQ